MKISEKVGSGMVIVGFVGAISSTVINSYAKDKAYEEHPRIVEIDQTILELRDDYVACTDNQNNCDDILEQSNRLLKDRTQIKLSNEYKHFEEGKEYYTDIGYYSWGGFGPSFLMIGGGLFYTIGRKPLAKKKKEKKSKKKEEKAKKEPRVYTVDEIMSFNLPKRPLALALGEHDGKRIEMESALQDMEGLPFYRRKNIEIIPGRVLSEADEELLEERMEGEQVQ